MQFRGARKKALNFVGETWRNPERLAALSAGITTLVAIVFTLPSLAIPMGLPPEGDGIDYRLPIVQWVVRHLSFPVWPWTIVDDYPSLGEIIMVPLYALSPGLVRLVPIFGYVGLAVAVGWLTSFFGRDSGALTKRTLFFTGLAWALAFRPVTIQSNLLMVDNLAACFLMMSLYFVLKTRAAPAGICAALAMSVRYTTWATAFLLPFLLLFLSPGDRRWRNFFIFGLLASLGPLPFMLRNFLVNHGQVFYPIGADTAWAATVTAYGRGYDFKSFLLFPYDLLYTNSFVKGLYDYTLGKLFYLQLCAVVVVAIFGPRAIRWPQAKNSALIAATIFSIYHLMAWFLTGQQLRFLIPSLVLMQVFMLLWVARRPRLLAAVTLLGVFSVLSVQKDSVLIFLGKKPSIFEASVRSARECLGRVGVGEETIGFVARDGVLSYLNHDFIFLFEHPFAVPVEGLDPPRWIYTNIPRAGYRPWPPDAPCLMKRVEG